MSAHSAEVVSGLGVPKRALVRQRVTKALLVEQLATTPADRRLVTSVVGAAKVVAVLAPVTTGMASYRDEIRDVSEVPVVSVALARRITPGERARFLDLLHRAFPKPVIAVIEHDDEVWVSFALVHANPADPDRSVVDEALVVALDEWRDAVSAATGSTALDRTNLWTHYRDLVQRSASASLLTRAASAEEAITRRREAASLEAHLDAVRRAARSETQIARRIELNAEARQLRDELSRVRGAR